MPYLIPSQIVDLIGQIFPATRNNGEFYVEGSHAILVGVVLDLIEYVPPHLIRLEGSDYRNFMASLAALRSAIKQWESKPTQEVKALSFTENKNPLTLLYELLSRCPDEYPEPATASLNFVDDSTLRPVLRLDLSTANSSFSNQEWKACTVIAGSVVEALLLWALSKKRRPTIQKAIDNLVANRTLRSKPKPDDIEAWDFVEYIAVAQELKLITEETAKQCDLARGFRNLIHPGKTVRTGTVCNRGTAMSALAAVEHAISDLREIKK